MRYAIGAGVVLLVLLLAALVFIFSGAYSVAATEPHGGITRWALNTVMERSVASHAEGIQVPPLTDSVQIRSGFQHFREMCVICHGAPGVEPSEIGKGLNPDPPELSEEVEEWSPAELHWIVKHGIKMTGMPAFGATHSDEEIWAIVAFLQRLRGASPAEYQRMQEAWGGGQTGHAEEGHAEAPDHSH